MLPFAYVYQTAAHNLANLDHIPSHSPVTFQFAVLHSPLAALSKTLYTPYARTERPDLLVECQSTFLFSSLFYPPACDITPIYKDTRMAENETTKAFDKSRVRVRLPNAHEQKQRLTASAVITTRSSFFFHSLHDVRLWRVLDRK